MNSNGNDITTHSLSNIYQLLFAESRVPFYKYIALAKSSRSRQLNQITSATPCGAYGGNSVSRESCARSSYEPRFAKQAFNLPSVVGRKQFLKPKGNYTLIPLKKYKRGTHRENNKPAEVNKSAIVSSSRVGINKAQEFQSAIKKTVMDYRKLIEAKSSQGIYRSTKENEHRSQLVDDSFVRSLLEKKEKSVKVVLDIQSRLNVRRNEGDSDDSVDFEGEKEVLRPVFAEVLNKKRNGERSFTTSHKGRTKRAFDE